MEQNGCVVLFSYSRVDYLLGINLVNSGDLWAGDGLEREKEKRREKKKTYSFLSSLSPLNPRNG